MNIKSNKDALLALGEQDKAMFEWEREYKCFPATENTSRETKAQEGISAYLCKGAENAISADALCQLIGCDARTLRKRVHNERKMGAVILSTKQGGASGYFLAADGQAGKEEIEHFISSLTSQAKNTLAILMSAKMALRQAEEQISMDLEDVT